MLLSSLIPSPLVADLQLCASWVQYLDAVVEQASDRVSLVRVTADMAESERGRELDDAHDERCVSNVAMPVYNSTRGPLLLHRASLASALEPTLSCYKHLHLTEVYCHALLEPLSCLANCS